MSSAEKTLPTSGWRALARRFFARVLFSYLLGLSVAVLNFLIDLLLSSMSFPFIISRAASYLMFVVVVNSVSIAILTYTSRPDKSALPPWWALPASLGILSGLMLTGFFVTGTTSLYSSAIEAFIVGAVAGLAVGVAYTLSIPGLRQDTILRQSRRSIIIGGVIGVQYSIYLLIQDLPLPAGSNLIFIVASFAAVPITIVGLLLSFVLGIELGDRYTDREKI